MFPPVLGELGIIAGLEEILHPVERSSDPCGILKKPTGKRFVRYAPSSLESRDVGFFAVHPYGDAESREFGGYVCWNLFIPRVFSEFFVCGPLCFTLLFRRLLLSPFLCASEKVFKDSFDITRVIVYLAYWIKDTSGDAIGLFPEGPRDGRCRVELIVFFVFFPENGTFFKDFRISSALSVFLSEFLLVLPEKPFKECAEWAFPGSYPLKVACQDSLLEGFVFRLRPDGYGPFRRHGGVSPFPDYIQLPADADDGTGTPPDTYFVDVVEEHVFVNAGRAYLGIRQYFREELLYCQLGLGIGNLGVFRYFDDANCPLRSISGNSSH